MKTKTKSEFEKELAKLRQRITELEASDSKLFKDGKAGQDLRKTGDYLENLINYANAPIIFWDPVFRITRFNPAFEHMTGHKSDDVMGKELSILFPDASRKKSMDRIKATSGGEYWESVEIPILCKDGGIRLVLWNSANVYADDGKTLLSTIAQGTDITARKQVEEELRETCDYLENLINYANAPIIVWDPAFSITRFNHAFEHMTGYKSNDVMGKELSILFPDSSRKESMDRIKATSGGEYWESVEIPILCKDGSVRLALWNSANIYIEDCKTLVSTIAQGTDITERKQAEEELEQINEFLKQERNMFISGPVVVFKWQNKEGWPVEYVSHNVKDVFGYSAEELLSGKIPYAEIIHNEDIDRVSNEVAAYSESGVENFKHKPYRIIRKDRKTIWIADYTTIVRDEAGKITHYLGYVEDITERLAAEQESKQAEKELANLYAKSEESRKSLLSILEDVTEKEQALQKSEEKFKTVADFTYSWEYWIDPDRNFIYISPSCERISGYKPEEFYKDPELLEKIIHPDDKEKVINHQKIESESKKVCNVDFRIIIRNGDIRCIGHVCRPVYGKDGNYLGRRATNRDITDNRRQETIRQMMYQISNAVYTTKDLHEFYKVIHLELGKVLKTKNFFIALYDKENDTLSLPYFIDEKDDFKSFPARKTLTAYVIKNNKPVILTEKEIKKLISSGEIEAVGTISKIWLGVPLISKEEVIGVLVVQSYENEKDFDKKDLELLKFISGQIGLSIERKQSEDFIRIQRDIAMELNDVTGLDETLRVCLDASIRISGMDCGGIYLVDKDTGNLDLAFHKGLPENFVKSASHFDAGSSNARLVMAGKPVYSQHQKLDVDINNNRKQENLRAIAVIPMLHEGKVIACLNIASHFYDEVPANACIALQTIAAQIGNVIARVNTAKELKDSEEKYRQVVDNSLVGNYISQNYILKFCNQQLAEIFGYNNADEMLEKDMREIIISESREFAYSEVKLRKPGEKDFSRYEFKGIKKDGSLTDIEVLGGRILYQGKPAMQGTLIDITERKKYEEKLKIAKEKAEESDRLKSAFLSTMSHELRTPLNAVIGFSELIDESLPMDVITDFAETINDSGTHLLNIIEDIFDISTLETGDMKVIKEEFSLKKAIKEVSDSIKAEQKKEKKECLNIYLYPDKKVQYPVIYTDKHKLKQIMINLLKNAIKFTLEGHIEYGYEIEDEKNILFFVKDTGVGIPKDKQEIIFDRFRQADDSHTRKFGGTGLGLAIVKHLVEILGGKIWLSSETDKGSEFYFSLPCYIADDSIKKTSEADITKTGIDLSGKVILVADDVESVYHYMKAILRKTNVRLIWAKDGQEAIDICKENKNISLVLMDIQMPVLNGLEATRLIKQFRKDLPIIAQTAYALKGDREMSLNAGCDDYITKPIDTKILFTTIEKHI